MDAGGRVRAAFASDPARSRGREQWPGADEQLAHAHGSSGDLVDAPELHRRTSLRLRPRGACTATEPGTTSAPELPTFSVIPLRDEVRRAIDEMGWQNPTPVQIQAYPLAINGRDIIVQSVRTFPGLTVTLPGSDGQKAPFAGLSRTGGVIDAYAAVKLALQREALRP